MVKLWFESLNEELKEEKLRKISRRHNRFYDNKKVQLGLIDKLIKQYNITI